MIQELLTLWDEYLEWAEMDREWDIENDCREEPDHSLYGFMEYLRKRDV